MMKNPKGLSQKQHKSFLSLRLKLGRFLWGWTGKCARQIHIKVLKKVEIINLKIYKFLKAYIKMGKFIKFSPT